MYGYGYHQGMMPAYQTFTPPPALPPAPRPPSHKRALCIGCNYPGTDAELRGCITDCMKWASILRSQFGISDIKIMTDGQTNPYTGKYVMKNWADPTVPIKKNLLAALDWLVEGARSGDVLVLTFSGHGTQVPDYSGDEDDGFDEAICPTDCEKSEGLFVPYRLISDDEIHKKLDTLPGGVMVTIVMDCCHSGTMVDTKFSFDSGHKFLSVQRMKGEPRGVEVRRPRGKRVPKLIEGDCPDMRAWLDPTARALHALPRRSPTTPGSGFLATVCRAFNLFKKKSTPFAPGTVVYCISGCRDEQTSLDAMLEGQQQGALSYCMQSALRSMGYAGNYDEAFKRACDIGNRIRSTMMPCMDQYFQFSYNESANPKQHMLMQPVAAPVLAPITEEAPAVPPQVAPVKHEKPEVAGPPKPMVTTLPPGVTPDMYQNIHFQARPTIYLPTYGGYGGLQSSMSPYYGFPPINSTMQVTRPQPITAQ
ncbi:unnamed protein product [Vitrella brassicaformis CCMP3155]|uniref:Peptidase C14 caspase domain-containing protein n=1 Tax=Vitrella brassicaformis (strain CCMP3155) TaxID=1169540 RepID=A0A0G4GF87_VITBC|nr:unnamed protein product [Vitrella brassicaformis CCMP3155]|mmetsp:Transcript_1861/g.4063  ORF Transcript_1861/g.4063 Transcript_1861/m.4063 type:complete len:478 (-) Transcript_1861:149-1582(-)|eukprot:CEM28179.1 unnamed protein product [Vitrella brassicaformis CCMP3155]